MSIEIINISVALIIIVLPFLLAVETFRSWLIYRRLKYVRNALDPVVLKLSLPPEVAKSPRSMEVIFALIWNQSKSSGGADMALIDGRVRKQVSFEIASVEGVVDFYIHTPKALSQTIQNGFYSQYPGIEIEAVDDYLPAADVLLYEREFMGFYWKKKRPAPDPIVTYAYYDHDKNPDEELKVDPLLALIEYLGSLGHGELSAYQFIVRPNAKEDWKMGEALPFRKRPDLHGLTAKWIQDKKEEMTDKVLDTGGKTYNRPNYLPGEPEKIKRFRDLDDQDTFDMYVRGFYMAKPENFRGFNVGAMTNSVKQFSHAGGNSISTGFETGTNDEEEELTRFLPFGKRWQAWITKRRKMTFMLAFKRRSAFYPPHADHGYTSSKWQLFSEELATLYHLPGTAATTPTLGRIGARKSDPPANLPT